MTIEVAIVISGISLAFALYQGISNLKRNNKADAAKEASSLTTVIIKLENIGNDISSIKADMRIINVDVKEQSLKIAKLEQQVKALEKNVFQHHDSKEKESNCE